MCCAMSDARAIGVQATGLGRRFDDGERVIDVFYVKDKFGLKIENKEA